MNRTMHNKEQYLVTQTKAIGLVFAGFLYCIATASMRYYFPNEHKTIGFNHQKYYNP